VAKIVIIGAALPVSFDIIVFLTPVKLLFAPVQVNVNFFWTGVVVDTKLQVLLLMVMFGPFALTNV